MKIFNDVNKVRNELKANLEGCGICTDITLRTVWFGGSIFERPNCPYMETDEGVKRVMLEDGIRLDLGIGKEVYVLVGIDCITIWTVNAEKKCYDLENVFWCSDYKTRTIIQMAVACELTAMANRVKD